MILTKTQKKINKRIRYLQTKTYAIKQFKKENKNKLKEWGRKVRELGECAICKDAKNLDAHHILKKERWPEYKFEEFNGICLCKKHHKFGKYSAHNNELRFAEWLKENRYLQYKWVMERNGYTNTSL